MNKVSKNDTGLVHIFLLFIILLIGALLLGYFTFGKNMKFISFNDRNDDTVPLKTSEEFTSTAESDFEQCANSKGSIIYAFPKACINKGGGKVFEELTDEQIGDLVLEYGETKNWNEYKVAGLNLTFKYPKNLYIVKTQANNLYSRNYDQGRFLFYNDRNVADCSKRYFETEINDCEHNEDVLSHTFEFYIGRHSVEEYESMDYKDGKTPCGQTKLNILGNDWYFCEVHQSGGNPESYDIFSVYSELTEDGYVYPTLLVADIDEMEDYLGMKLEVDIEGSNQRDNSPMTNELGKLNRQILSTINIY